MYLLEQALAVEQRVRRVLAAERAAHWARQARDPGGEEPDARAAGAEDDERGPDGGAPR